MSKHDNITELYYRLSFGECIALCGIPAAQGSSSEKECHNIIEKWCFLGCEGRGLKSRLANSVYAFSKAHRGLGSVISEQSLFVLSSFIFTNSFGGTIEPKTTNNFPTITRLNLLLSRCMGLLRVGGSLEMVSVKTILTLGQQNRPKILSNGLPFHLRPVVYS